MKIGIIGYGVVGRAVANTMSKRYDVVNYDKFEEHDKFSELLDSDFIFITVPTPFDCEKNKVDDSAIVESLERLQGHNYRNIVIIKSTLPPESCDKYCNIFDLIITYNPEFLRESTSPNEDFENQDTIVIGSVQSSHFKKVKKMYEDVAIAEASYFHMTLLEAEMVKYAQNTMLASRVALANMIFDACKEHGIEYDKIRKVAFDRFEIIGVHMTEVPGPDGKRGFGGKCLPKDIRGFSTILSSELLHQIIKYNDALRDDLDNFLINYNNRQ